MSRSIAALSLFQSQRHRRRIGAPRQGTLRRDDGRQAGCIFDQSIDLTVGAEVSDRCFKPLTDPRTCPTELADDFKLLSGASTITDIHWWGVYGNTNTPGNDPFSIRIFGVVGGRPGIEPLNELDYFSLNRVDTGVDIADELDAGFDVFAYSVEISPLTLEANTAYWLSIVNGSPFENDTVWL